MCKLLTNVIKAKAHEIGFDLVGVSPARDFPESQYYKKWLDKGYQASMDYMSKDSDRREDVRNIFPGATSIISCAVNYNTDHPYSTEVKDKSTGWIARYAWGDDYHLVMKNKLVELKEFIEEKVESDGLESMVYVDTGPVLERMYAKYSGIGWIGKNTCLINQDIGSWFFLGEIITNMELEYDNPAVDRCGTCTACIDACPTSAIIEPNVLDSNRCISFFTIENKGKIPIDSRGHIGNNIFGCDICQDVCPWNNRAKITEEVSYLPRKGFFSPELRNLVNLDRESFSKLFKNSPVKRAKRKGLIRNILVSIGNSGDENLVPLVEKVLEDEEPIIRSHAVWALWKLEGNNCLSKLQRLLANETDNEVVQEIDYIKSRINDESGVLNV